VLSRCAALVYAGLRPHRAALFAVVGVLCLAAVLWARTLAVREDIRILLPATPERLGEQFALLREAPFLRRLTITVGGGGHDPAALADMTANALRGKDIPLVVTGPDVAPGPAVLGRLCDFLPGLLADGDLARLRPLLEEAAVAESLREDKRTLLGASGPLLRDLVAKDPLRLREVLYARLAPSAPFGLGGDAAASGPHIVDGHLLDASGRYAMVLAEPAAPMTDSEAAGRVMDRCRDALRGLPPDATALVAGGHRHTEANAAAVKGDLARVLPVSTVCLALLFLVFIRSAKGVALFLLPLASFLAALVVSGLSGAVSGIVIGFGSVVIGITADYAIHVFYALKGAPDPARALALVARPLGMGFITTLASFAALLFSAIPAISRMAVFAVAGLVPAFILALAVLPQCLAGAATPALPCAAPPGDAPRPRLCFRHPAGGWFCLALAACMLWLAATVPVSGDMRLLAYAPEDVRRDEAETARNWGDARSGTLIAAPGGEGDEGDEQALRVNDAVWRILGARGVAGAVSLAPFLPSRETQEERHRGWEAFWAEHGTGVLARLEALRGDEGFSRSAFAPFAGWIAQPPPLLTPKGVAELGLGFVADSLRSVREDGSILLFTLLPEGAELPAGVAAELEKAGARIAAAGDFRETAGEATRGDCLRFCLFSLLAVGGLLFAFFPSFSRWALAMLPLTAGMVAVTAAFRIFGLPMTVFHAAAIPLIMGLGADYGIFMVTSLEGGNTGATRKAVLLSGLSTLAGFGSLLLARHPALFSLGLAVGAGMAVVVAAALWGIPRMSRIAGEEP
jgi:predicted exporter